MGCCGKLKKKKLNPYKSSAFLVGLRQNSADPFQTSQNMGSNQGLHCLLTGPIKI